MINKKRVIALGFFDGLHVGHAGLMEMTKRRGQELGALPTVLTFDIHPDTLVSGVQVPLINAPEGRADIIRRIFGIDSVIFLHFNKKIMEMPWKEFIVSLIDELDACHFVVGHDFTFGWKGEGKAYRLAEFCLENGLGCDIIPAIKIDGEIVSSTHIRALIENGEIDKANRLLGHPHILIDTVHYGFQLGMKLGTPTINMYFSEGVIVPRHGVYATKVYIDGGGEHLSVTNIGVRPTVSGEKSVSVESYILDFEGDLYDHKVRVEFHQFLREEQKFSSIDELRAQILLDADMTREYFSRLNK